MIRTFSDFTGHIITKIERSDAELIFTLVNGEMYKLYHAQDCCESVYLEDVAGDLVDLIGVPILKAEEATSNDTHFHTVRPQDDQSFTWTFYHIATIKGYVTLRWYGSSNGHYSESVDLAHWVDGRWIDTHYEGHPVQAAPKPLSHPISPRAQRGKIEWTA